MKAKTLTLGLAILVIIFLQQTSINSATTNQPSGPLQPGSASGKLAVNVQTFKLKYAYARTIEAEQGSEGASILVLLTNRKFPQDLSKLTRFEIGKWMDRYDLHGIDFGLNEQKNLMFLDVLRAPNMIITAQFEPGDRKQGEVSGRIYTNGEIRYFRNRVKFDLKFNAKIVTP
jgi:hypothetical protein